MINSTIPTKAQRDYATKLIKLLEYDIDDYNFDDMTRSELSELIDDLYGEYNGGAEYDEN